MTAGLEAATVETRTRPAFCIGIVKEVHAGERRVAAVPATVARLKSMGIDVLVESGAGQGASFVDQEYAEAGARIAAETAAVWAEADLVLKVRAPEAHPTLGKHEADLLREGGRLICFVWPATNPELVARLAQRGSTVLAMDAVPRISRAQKLDALSAMANLAGYKAVLEAANCYGRSLGGQMTAAGRARPARVLVLGAGVAGLAALAAAKRLGAVVKAFDTRKEARQQVESLGGQFIELDLEESGEGEGGYAKQITQTALAAEQALIARHAKDADIIITTALVPGKPAPLLVTSGAVVGMPHGSVIVDLAIEQGGNCALAERDKVVERFGVTIIGLTDLTSRMALQASELYAATVCNLIEEIWDAERGFVIDTEDQVQRTMLVVHEGRVTWPPPTPTVRAAAPRPVADHPVAAAAAEAPARWPMWTAWVGAALLLGVGTVVPPGVLNQLTIFLLACVLGWHLIWNVTPALHTPLMSVTNAISGIILVGGVLLTARGGISVATVLAATAVLVATINVAGGFFVTRRMLLMFRR